MTGVFVSAMLLMPECARLREDSFITGYIQVALEPPLVFAPVVVPIERKLLAPYINVWPMR